MTSFATIPNPFSNSIVSDSWKLLEADVPAIHQKAFTRCCEAMAEVRAKHQTTGWSTRLELIGLVRPPSTRVL